MDEIIDFETAKIKYLNSMNFRTNTISFRKWLSSNSEKQKENKEVQVRMLCKFLHATHSIQYISNEITASKLPLTDSLIALISVNSVPVLGIEEHGLANVCRFLNEGLYSPISVR